MKRTTLNFLFLLLIGLIIGWKEWVIAAQPNEMKVKENVETMQEEGVISFNRAHLRAEQIATNNFSSTH